MDNTLKQVRQKLSHLTMAQKPTMYLDTKIPELNCVIGHKDFGIPYGRIIEVYGLESAGKSAITMSLAALAQMDGAFIVWGDVENSWNGDWAVRRGLAKCDACNGACYDSNGDACKVCEGGGCDQDKICVVSPFVGTFEGEKGERLSTAEEILAEVEGVWNLKAKKHKKMWVVIDSLEALLPQAEAEAGIGGKRRMGSKAVLVGELLRRWIGLAQARSTNIILINQMRMNPGTHFGSPWYTTGGNAPRYYAHIRLRCTRAGGSASKIITGGKTTGIRGILKCDKNKAGGIEGAAIGYKLLYDAPIQFLSEKALKAEVKLDDE